MPSQRSEKARSPESEGGTDGDSDDTADSGSDPQTGSPLSRSAKAPQYFGRDKRGSSVQYAEDSDESQSEEDVHAELGDDNDEYCTICQTKEDLDNLLCCDLCPRVFHLYCFKPPLKSIPKGDWFCSECRPLLQLDNVERFLASRRGRVDLAAEKAASEAALRQGTNAETDAAASKKRKGTSAASAAQSGSKRHRMASVQELHTSKGTDSNSHTLSQQKSTEASAADTDAENPDHQASRDDPNKPHAKSISPDTTGTAADEPNPEQQRPDALRQAALDTSKTALKPSPASQDGKQAEQALTQVKEYLVKWKDKSHMHCTWVRQEDVIKMGQKSSGLKSRLRHFLQSTSGAQGTAAESTEDVLSVGEKVDGIDPDWVTADRVIAEQQKKGQLHYLVKWKGLAYQDATWELEEDLVPKFAVEIARFEALHPIAAEAAERKKQNPQANNSQTNKIRSAAGRQVGMRKFSSSPSFLRGGDLHPYQLEGLNWLFFAWEQSKHVILADEMGLGKTIQTIAFLAALKEQQIQRPHLVVVPLSTFPNWEREFALWAPQLNVVPFLGNQASRDTIKQYEFYADKALQSSKSRSHNKTDDKQARVKFHVLLTTYEMAVTEGTVLRSLQYETLVVDEGHRLKNKQSRLFQQLHGLRARQRTLLTGTPLQNNLQELWMLLHFLDASKFENLEQFQEDFSDLSHGDQVGKLHELLSPHLLRRLKKDVLKQLPPKKEQIVRVELSALQKEWYRAILTRNFLNLTATGKQTGRLKSVMMELRKCCNHPFLLEGQEWPLTQPPEAFRHQMVQASGKLALVDSMLARMKAQGHRVLIYSQFTTLLDLLEEWLAARGWGFQRIDGSVSSSERQSRIDQFNRRPADNFVFLLSTKAGGLGINLATADTVIIYDSDWNPHNDLQAQARAHRLGQKKPVMIYRLVTRLTIEERMMQQTKKKMVLEHLVVRKMNAATDLKQDELDDILRYGAAELFADAVAASKTQAQQAATAAAEEGAAFQADSKKAVEKADKLTQRLSEREQAEGRMGGEAGQRIVYDQAAIDRLLDRSDLDKPDADQAEEQEDDFVKAFKVANFEVIDSHGADKKAEEETAVAQQEQVEDKGQQPAAAFWEELLKDGYTDLQEVQMAALGKGKRERRQVNYDEKNAKDGHDSEYSGNSAADDDFAAEEEVSPDKPAAKRQKSSNVAYVLTAAEWQAVQPVRQQRQASINAGAPLATGSGAHHRVLDVIASQRTRFMSLLMQFGLGTQLQGGQFDWSHIAKRMPALSLAQVSKYAELVMAQLSEPANDRPFFADGILKKDILQFCGVNEVLDRLGTLHLIRQSLLAQMNTLDTSFTLGLAHAQLLAKTQYWKAPHDKRLLYGVMTLGHGAWQNIYLDQVLDLETTLRQELGLPPPLLPQADPQLQTHLPPQPRPQAQTHTQYQAPWQGQSRPQLPTQGQPQAPKPAQGQSQTLLPPQPQSQPQSTPQLPLQPQMPSQGQQQSQVQQTSLPSTAALPPTSSAANTAPGPSQAPATSARVEPETDRTQTVIGNTDSLIGQALLTDTAGTVAMALGTIASDASSVSATKGDAEMVEASPADAAGTAPNTTASASHTAEALKGDAEMADAASAAAQVTAAAAAQVTAAAAQAQQTHHAAEPSASAAALDQTHDSQPAVAQQTAGTSSSVVSTPLQQQQQQPVPQADPGQARPGQVANVVTSGSQQLPVEVSLLLQDSGHVQVSLQVTPGSVTPHPGTAAGGVLKSIATSEGQAAAPPPSALPGAPSLTGQAAAPMLTGSAGTSGALLSAPVPAQAARMPLPAPAAVGQGPAVVLRQLGCSKCRWARTGCKQCQERLRQVLSPADAARVLAEGAFADRMTSWLQNRVNVLCNALKQKLTGPPAGSQAQPQQAGCNTAQQGQGRALGMPTGAVVQTGPAAPVIHQVTMPVTIMQARPSGPTNAVLTPASMTPRANLLPVMQHRHPVLQLQPQPGTAQASRFAQVSAGLPQQTSQAKPQQRPSMQAKQQQQQITQVKQQQRMLQQQHAYAQHQQQQKQQQQQRLLLEQQVRQQHAAKQQQQQQHRIAQLQKQSRQHAARPQASQAAGLADNMQPASQQLHAALHGQAFAQGKSTPITSGQLHRPKSVSSSQFPMQTQPCSLQPPQASQAGMWAMVPPQLATSAGFQSVGHHLTAPSFPGQPLPPHAIVLGVPASLHQQQAYSQASQPGVAGSHGMQQALLGRQPTASGAQSAQMRPQGMPQYTGMQSGSMPQSTGMQSRGMPQPSGMQSTGMQSTVMPQSSGMQQAGLAASRGSTPLQQQPLGAPHLQAGLQHYQALSHALAGSPRAAPVLQQAGLVASQRGSPNSRQQMNGSPGAASASQQTSVLLRKPVLGSPLGSSASPGAVSGPQRGSTASPMAAAGVQQRPFRSPSLRQVQAAQQGLAGGSAPHQRVQTSMAAQTAAPDSQVGENIRSELRNMKPNLRAVDEDMLPSLPIHAKLPAESMRTRREWVAGLNSLCEQLLDVQVELTMNQPASMTDSQRTQAATSFQSHMQGMEAKCYEMIDSLQAASAPRQAVPANSHLPVGAVSSQGLKPVLLRHINRTQQPPASGQAASDERQVPSTTPAINDPSASANSAATQPADAAAAVADPHNASAIRTAAQPAADVAAPPQGPPLAATRALSGAAAAPSPGASLMPSTAARIAEASKPSQKGPSSNGRAGGGLASLIIPPARPAGPTISTGAGGKAGPSSRGRQQGPSVQSGQQPAPSAPLSLTQVAASQQDQLQAVQAQAMTGPAASSVQHPAMPPQAMQSVSSQLHNPSTRPGSQHGQARLVGKSSAAETIDLTDD